jgi:acyl dehydratase
MGIRFPRPLHLGSTIEIRSVRQARERAGCGRLTGGALSHPVLEGKPNANHVRDRIRNSHTQ